MDMINVAIYGTNNASLYLNQLIDEIYNRYVDSIKGEALQVVCFIDFLEADSDDLSDTNAITVNCEEFVKLYKMNVVEAVMIPTINHMGFHFIITELLRMGVRIEDIYYASREYFSKDIFSISEAESLFIPYLNSKYIPYLEYHVADHCNLNCKACEHYSPLVKEPHFTNYEKFSRDLDRLSEFITDIGHIRILGGEPLLNPELHKYVGLTRKKYPYALIIIVTNGLLIKQMPVELIDAIRENDVYIHISWYRPLKEKQESILEFLTSKGLQYTNNMGFSDIFTVKQGLEGNTDKDRVFFRCFQSHCNNLYEGKIAACFLPFVTKYFNDTFNKELPVDESMDLYDKNLTTERLKRFLLTSMERCKFCKEPKEIPWELAQKKPVLNDWII